MPDDCKLWNVLGVDGECGDDGASRLRVFDDVDEADDGEDAPVSDGDVTVAFVDVAGVTMFSTESELFDLLELETWLSFCFLLLLVGFFLTSAFGAWYLPLFILAAAAAAAAAARCWRCDSFLKRLRRRK